MRVLPALLLLSLVSGCANPAGDELRRTTKASYDAVTGRLKELTFDSNKNGRIDTWTDMDGPRAVRSRIDRDEDGKIDRWEYYGADGQLLKVGFSRKNDGKADAWAYANAAGAVERIEISSTGDEHRIDRWERYGPGGLIAADEDTNGDGIVDKWETYDGGALKTALFDETHDGKPDRLLTYAAGSLVTIDSEPDSSGHFTKRADVHRLDDPAHRR